MLDVILIGAFVFLLVRGWYRGFVREAMDLVGPAARHGAGFSVRPGGRGR